MKFFQPTSTMQSSGLARNSSNESLSNLLEEEVNYPILGNWFWDTNFIRLSR